VDPEATLRYFWRGFSIAYLSTGPSKLREIEISETIPDWITVIQTACRSSDDHTIKLAYSGFEEFQKYANRNYRIAAMRFPEQEKTATGIDGHYTNRI